MGKVAYLFPGQGQGSIKKGMGYDIWSESERARKVFFEADYYLGNSLSNLCFFGPEEELLKTINAQLASLIVNLAYLAAGSDLEEEGAELEFIPKGVPPDYLAGHSVGYTAALVYAGTITFHQALDIVRKRASLMSQACQKNPGKMIILLSPKNLEVKALGQKLDLGGNFNSEDQIVLSGLIEAIEKAEAQIRQGKLAKEIRPLKTEGAFHSKCMESVKEPFREFLESIPFADPKIPIIGNSQAQVITTAREAKKELVDHLCLPVLWHQSIEVLRNLGVTTFIEIGHGQVLANILRRGLKTATVVAIPLSVAIAGYFLHRKRRV